MITNCFFCQQPLAPNHELELFQQGTRVAYDPARGRLWAVCAHCRRWTLAPFESRWEVLEQLERIVRDQADLLFQGENVALMRAGSLDALQPPALEQRREPPPNRLDLG